MRSAISPRFAIRIFLNMRDFLIVKTSASCLRPPPRGGFGHTPPSGQQPVWARRGFEDLILAFRRRGCKGKVEPQIRPATGKTLRLPAESAYMSPWTGATGLARRPEPPGSHRPLTPETTPGGVVSCWSSLGKLAQICCSSWVGSSVASSKRFQVSSELAWIPLIRSWNSWGLLLARVAASKVIFCSL